uniref:Retrotransposon Copia-like N-terminal domain-containing protein n=1 Tax=Davidia involucrata TaxID=16924 RepID=A0A5B7BN30_DAVIN
MVEKENDKGSSSSDAQGSNNDPFFIHHSDNPTVILVSPLPLGDNYRTWFRAMTLVLYSKNKIGVVDGSIEQPKGTDELRQWERCTDLVSSWILNSIESEIRGSIFYADTARGIWVDLVIDSPKLMH